MDKTLPGNLKYDVLNGLDHMDKLMQTKSESVQS